MKKLFCLWLILWLPCFGMATSVMSMQMQLAELAAPVSVAAEDMPCHHTHTQSSDMQHHDDFTSSSTHHHHCNVCGYCMLSSGVARLDRFPTLQLGITSAQVPLFLALPVYSLTFPPAIKPPISI